MATDDKMKIIRDAERLVLQGKFALAISEYLKIVKNDPTDMMTLNTIGDLYLRLRRVSEAHSFFLQVGENYARNNFFLKAIAVYRKILSADPQNLSINQTLASLYAKQGLNVDARDQYLRLADICAREGKVRESREAYEKVVELDPMSSAVQLKLAEICLAEGSTEKAGSYFAGAARAQAKAGDLKGAVNSFTRAIELNPADVDVMRDLLEVGIRLGDVTVPLEHINKSLSTAPDDVSLLEMLGRAQLASRDLEGAAKTFQAVVASDASRYRHLLEVHKAFLAAGDQDSAIRCLDSVLPILISRRESQHAVEAYKAILESNPEHIQALTKLSEVYYATNDQPCYLEAVDRIARFYLNHQNPREALEYLDKILQIKPDSQKHLALHQDAFLEAYPDAPYRSPVQAVETRPESTPDFVSGTPDQAVAPGELSSNSKLVEADLLLNYGMRQKAMDLLRELEAQNPSDKDVHLRLLSLYREENQLSQAAEQCLLLASEYFRSGNAESSQKYLLEAGKLDPAFVDSHPDLVLAAEGRRAAEDESASGRETLSPRPAAGFEVDLSEDLAEIFFKDASESDTVAEAPTAPAVPDETVAEYTPLISPRPISGSFQDQLQEVDFYIRLSFCEEARSKLDQLAREYPDNPELAVRYRQIAERGAQQSAAPLSSQEADRGSTSPVETGPPAKCDAFTELTLDRLAESCAPAEDAGSHDETGTADAGTSRQMERMASKAAVEGAGSREEHVNAMFADLIDEVNSLADQESAREDFERHFGLGIAYREMNLGDEAIKEFQAAIQALNPANSPREVIQCCGQLSTCFLEKGMPRSAIRWCETGLSIPEVFQHEAMALRYDMGVAFATSGDSERALDCFGFVFNIDPSYRDVAQKIDAIRGGPGRNVP